MQRAAEEKEIYFLLFPHFRKVNPVLRLYDITLRKVFSRGI